MVLQMKRQLVPRSGHVLAPAGAECLPSAERVASFAMQRGGGVTAAWGAAAKIKPKVVQDMNVGTPMQYSSVFKEAGYDDPSDFPRLHDHPLPVAARGASCRAFSFSES